MSFGSFRGRELFPVLIAWSRAVHTQGLSAPLCNHVGPEGHLSWGMALGWG